ncbi:hypothetical protein NBRC116188_15630 [Oceaniserpentilla sp. 4NH20-0058]|uniref:hypothetical protein n=1 Tax=Oceaniserpentilla sp. 4NH20-0058 TaxID=3127660 RepID=UPI00310A0937
MTDDVNSKISLPTINKDGVNKHWIPGGFTSGGMPEATYSGSTFEKHYNTKSIDDFFGG